LSLPHKSFICSIASLGYLSLSLSLSPILPFIPSFRHTECCQ